MSFSNAFETHILQYVFTTTSVTRPTAYYVGLFTSNPAEDASGTELSGSGYTRIQTTFSVSGAVAQNAALITFPTATGSWGTVTHAGVFTASTSGTLIAYHSLTASKTIAATDILQIAAGSLTITLD